MKSPHGLLYFSQIIVVFVWFGSVADLKHHEKPPTYTYYGLSSGKKVCCKSYLVGELIASIWDVEALVVDLGEMRDVIEVDKLFKGLLAAIS